MNATFSDIRNRIFEIFSEEIPFLISYLCYCIYIPKKYQVKKSESLVMKIMKRFWLLVRGQPTFFQISVLGIVETKKNEKVGIN